MPLKRLPLLPVMLLAASLLPAQALDTKLLKGLKPRNIGPAGMSGRVTALAAQADNPDIIFAGTASGGIWRSHSGGTRWEPVFDKQPVQSIGAIAIDPQNPSIIWAGTGEGNPRNSHNSGAGIFRSPDGGRTWACMGLQETRTIHRVIVHPRNSDVVWAAATGSPWGPHPDRGVFKTTNGGKDWQKVLYINDTTGCADLVIDPRNPDKLYAAMWQHHRQPWTFRSGGPGSGLHISHDGGKTWEKRDDRHGLPAGEIGRIGLATCASAPDVVYAMVESQKTALYRSNDGGFSWKLQNDKETGGRPFYYAEIHCDPQNENRLYNLHTIVTVSEDAGKSWKPLLPWSSGIHPDHHAFYIHPSDPSFLIDGNDGGLAISRDKGRSWHFAANIPVSQFYHVNHDMEQPYNVMGGMQDNGSYVGPSAVWADGGIRNHHWRETSFGDGFGMMAKPGDPRTLYSMSQAGHLYRVDKETGHTAYIRPLPPAGQRLRFNWNAPIAQDPFSPCTIYYGSQFVHRSTDCGDSWTVISPDLSSNDSTKQRQAKSGGLTIDATGAENHTTLIAIAPSPKQQGQIWAGSDDGRLHLTMDGGRSWTDLSKRLPGAPEGAWISWIEASPHHAGEAFVVLNDYRRNNWAPYLYHTRDNGQSWRQIANGVTGHCLSMAQDPAVERLLYLGTDQGLWISTDAGASWAHFTNGFPPVPVSSLKVHPRDHDLIIGTFGRAIWILDDLQALREASRKGPAFWKQPFDLVSATPAIAAEWRSVDAGRFLGNDEFQGENLRRGTLLTFYFPAPTDSSGKAGKEGKGSKAEKEPKTPGDKGGKGPDPDKLRITILLGPDTIRTFSAKADTGLTRIRWDLDRNGAPWLSPNAPDPDADPATGPMVRPGRYRVIAQWRGYRDSLLLEVQPDPRIPLTEAEMGIREEMLRTHDRAMQAAADGYGRLREAKESVERIEGLLKAAPTALRDSLAKAAKPIRDSIRSLQALFIAPEDFKGIDHLTHRLSTTLDQCGGRLATWRGMPGPEAREALDRCLVETRAVLARVNRFLSVDWVAYRAKVEAAQAPLFKNLEPVKLD